MTDVDFDDARVDPVSAALRRTGDASGHRLRHLTARWTLRRPGAAADARIAKALAAVSARPDSVEAQLAAARLLEESADTAGVRDIHEAIARRFPGSIDAVRRFYRLVRRREGHAAALAALAGLYPSLPEEPQAAAALAMALAELGRLDQADETFDILTDEHPAFVRGWLLYGRGLAQRGRPGAAAEVLARGLRHNPGSLALQRESAALRRSLASVDRLSGGRAGATEDPHAAAIAALLAGTAARRAATAPIPAHLGPTIMITSTLGAGGAERQLVNTALALHGAARRGRPIAGLDVFGPVTVLARSLGERAAAGFFLPDLRDAGVEVLDYGRFAPFGGDPELSSVGGRRELLDLLPRRMADGVARLTDFLAARRPAVVSIWQDGMVLAAAAAAILSDAPRIVLHVRTLPPSERADRHLPEYETLYRQLLATPGVLLAANSAHAARRYEAWLGLPKGRVRVVHNGLRPLTAEPLDDAGAVARAFDERTGPASFTLGAVMRFDANKRPLHWLEVAARIHARSPGARFLLVGDGPMRAAAEAHAAQIGLAHRCLFVGRSDCVGYWLSRMQAFLLLSRFEGLPNALIEAQSFGVPVVATPAGGTAETLIDGVTGRLLADAEEPDLDAAADEVLDLFATPDRLAAMGRAAKEMVADRFSFQRMAEDTVSVFLGGDGA